MVPRPNLGGNFISFLRPSPLGRGILPPTHACAHSGDSTRDRQLDSNVSYFLILIYLFAHTSLGSFFPFASVGDEWEDEYTPFGPNSFGVHPTNLQFVSLPMMGFEYFNGLPPIHSGPFRLMLESWPTQLWVTYWSIILALGAYPHLERSQILSIRGYLLHLLFVQPYILYSPNSKGQIKYVKIERMIQKLWHTLR